MKNKKHLVRRLLLGPSRMRSGPEWFIHVGIKCQVDGGLAGDPIVTELVS